MQNLIARVKNRGILVVCYIKSDIACVIRFIDFATFLQIRRRHKNIFKDKSLCVVELILQSLRFLTA